jgi:formate-dependent nitrite reductase complex subunit NrfG
MHRRVALLFPLLIAMPRRLRADLANGDVRKEKLFSRFMAPCCWRENLLVHHSPLADELRSEISRQIAAGQSDDEIKRRLVDQYSIRVLSQAEGTRGPWLWWTPVAAIVIGAFALGVFVRRARNADRPAPVETSTKLPELPETEWN